MDAKEWLKRVSGGASVNAAASQAKVPQKTLDTQLRSASGLKPEMVVKIARAYGKSPVAALAETGLISEIEARNAAGIRKGLEEVDIARLLGKATDAQLLEEIGQRLNRRKRRDRNYPGIVDDAARPDEGDED